MAGLAGVVVRARDKAVELAEDARETVLRRACARARPRRAARAGRRPRGRMPRARPRRGWPASRAAPPGRPCRSPRRSCRPAPRRPVWKRPRRPGARRVRWPMPRARASRPRVPPRTSAPPNERRSNPMTDLWPRLEALLGDAERPARYLNREWGCVYKPDADFRFCMVYPDTYELGQANQAVRILVNAVNATERHGRRARVSAGAGVLRHDARRGPAAVLASRAAPPWPSSTWWASRCRTSWRPRTCWRRSIWPASRCMPTSAPRATRSCWAAAPARSTPSRTRRSSTPSASARGRRPCPRRCARPSPARRGRAARGHPAGARARAGLVRAVALPLA